MQHAQTADFQPFDAKGWRLGIVTAQFNKHITQQLEDSCVARAAAYSINKDSIDIFKVAGSVEIPLVLQHLAKSGKYDALVAIGCVIRGATPHFDYVCKYVSEGVLRVQLDHSLPIGFGVLTCNDEAQAQERAHLGGEHLDAVLQQAKLMRDERFKLPVVVFLIIIKDDQVLLLNRQNTTWYNDSYDIPGGHIDGNESFVAAVQREAKEEIGIDIDSQDIKFKHLSHGFFIEDDKEYIYVFFEIKRWRGTPTNAEPDKSSELKWFPLDQLPDNLTPGTKEGLEAYKAGEIYAERGFN